MDPVTRGLSILFNIIHVDIDIPFWSQHISFILVGVIIATSIRGFLNVIMKVRNSLEAVDRAAFGSNHMFRIPHVEEWHKSTLQIFI